MGGERDLGHLLTSLDAVLDEACFVFATLPAGREVPGGLDVVASVREGEGLSIVVPAGQAERHRLAGEFPCARITLQVHSALEAVGLLAVVSTALADAGISANAVAGLHHDHLFVPWSRRDEALAVLHGLAPPPPRPRPVTDLRVCFLGESFVAGTGDAHHRGWVGRVAARTEHHGRPLTAYNLGVRRETSDDLLARWERECAPRLPPTADGRVVVSTGVNDTSWEDGGPRVAPSSSAANWRRLLEEVHATGWPVLAVGPPPVADDGHNERIVAVDTEYAAVCRALDVPYVAVVGALRDDET